MKKKFTPSLLRLARAAAGKSQRDIAIAIRRSPAFVHRLETGGPALLDAATAKQIAAVVGDVPVEQLFDVVEDK